nr:YdcF family protein [uncultured Blautia sp.]
MLEDFMKTVENFIFAEDIPEKADIIFVPGNGYPEMAEHAARLYREGYAPYILPSGKYSVVMGHFSGVLSQKAVYDGNYDTEWEFLKDVLVHNQVPEEAILQEDNATYTYENAIYSRKVTDALGLKINKAILCCKSYHARRALMYYQKLYPDTRFYVCADSPDGITRENWKNTEEGIQAVTGEVTRIIHQFQLML